MEAAGECSGRDTSDHMGAVDASAVPRDRDLVQYKITFFSDYRIYGVVEADSWKSA
jgi:hypothetical protein